MKYKIARKDGNRNAQLSGALDETFEKASDELLARLGDGHVVFDMTGVTRINSIGYHQWVRFLKALSAKATFELEACSVELLAYVNLLPVLSFASRVTSVRIPYVCKHCGKAVEPSFQLEEIDEGGATRPLICPGCNGIMEAEVSVPSLLAFRDAEGG